MNFASKTVLILGDSHTVGEPGRVLKRLLEADGASVTINGKVGRSAASFYMSADKTGGKVPFGYNVIVIVLGTNDALRDNTKSVAAMSRLLREASGTGAVVFLVGPPQQYRDDIQKGAEALRVAYRDLVGTPGAPGLARFVDSFPYTSPTLTGRTQKDHGVHFTKSGAEKWMTGVAGELKAAWGLRDAPNAVIGGVLLLGLAFFAFFH